MEYRDGEGALLLRKKKNPTKKVGTMAEIYLAFESQDQDEDIYSHNHNDVKAGLEGAFLLKTKKYNVEIE